MRAFVTGARGFLGSWLCSKLYQDGHTVVALTRDLARPSLFAKLGLEQKVTTVLGDICDRGLMEKLISEHEVDTVFHLAAQAIVGIAKKNPRGTVETNVMGTVNVLEACRASGVRHVVVASSDKAYGDAPSPPYSEDTPLRGRHPYDASKSCVDLLSQMYSRVYQLPVAVVRCGNLYGGGDYNLSRLIPGTIKDILEGRQPVIRSDGQLVRDYLHVEDAVNAYIACASHPDAAGQVFNFGTGQPSTVLQVVTKIMELLKCVVPVRLLRQATDEIAAQWLDCTKAQAILNWRPTLSLHDGLAQTVRWYSKEGW